jgi:hypothetical protein
MGTCSKLSKTSTDQTVKVWNSRLCMSGGWTESVKNEFGIFAGENASMHTITGKRRNDCLLYAHRHRSILGAAGHIILTPANQLMVMGLKINLVTVHYPGSNQRPFDHWPTSLRTALTRPTQLQKTGHYKSSSVSHVKGNST